MKILVLLSINILFTQVRAYNDIEIVRRGNFVIAASNDGYLCYGTKSPSTAECHEAIPAPTIK